MGSKNIPVLLVTANVGSIFEDPSVMLKIWTEEFLSTVARLDSKFIALHCQEVGGKNYEKSMNYVEDFVKLLMTSDELRLFDRVRVFIDEDYSSAENFTALGNIYFIHESVEEVLLWDFKDMQFVNVEGTEIFTGNIETVVTKEKAKFPQEFFPECKWSRKGFLRTRWSISGTVFDLINIHLFHDASNFIAMEEFPSVYCKNRRRALEHTLQRFHNDRYGPAPYFVFGDFNFRTDTDGVVKKLTEGLTTTKIPHHKSNDYTKLQFHSDDNKLVLTVGKKEFNHSDHQDVFLSSDGSWLKSFDKELEAFENQLFEFPVNFPASYPFEEKVSCATTYMQTRCPAWCDRVLLSQTAKTLIDNDTKIEYNIMGRETCMGDHKPVYLRLDIRSDTGIVSCCEHLTACSPDACKCCQNFASIEINIIECDYMSGQNSFADVVNVDRTLLHEPFTKDMLMHDPYTPESVESHSPLPNDRVIDSRVNPLEVSLLLRQQQQKQSISPALLKSRLEIILQSVDTGSTKIKKSDNNNEFNNSTNNNNNNNTNNTNKNNSNQTMTTLETASRSSKFLKLKNCRLLTKSQSQQLDGSRTTTTTDSLGTDGVGTFMRTRCLSESAKKNSRARLISSNSAQSMLRLQSHHSSSDEDWFEFEDTPTNRQQQYLNRILTSNTKITTTKLPPAPVAAITTTTTTITNANNNVRQSDNIIDNEVFDEIPSNIKINKVPDELIEDNNKNFQKKNKLNKKARCCCIS